MKLKKLLPVLQMAASVGLLLLVVSFIPLQSWKELLHASPSLLVAALAVLLFAQGVSAFRLARLMRGGIVELSFALAIKSTFLGYFCSAFLPSSIGGDAVKFIWLRRRIGNGPTLLTAMATERIISFFCSVIFAMFATGMLSAQIRFSSRLPEPKYTAVIFFFFLLGAVGCFLWLKNSTMSSAQRLRNYTKIIQAQLLFLSQHPGKLLECLSYSVLQCLLTSASLVLALYSIGGEITFLQAVSSLMLISILSTLPVGVNGLGVYEAGLSGFLVLYGVPVDIAAKTAILMRILGLLSAFPGVLGTRDIFRVKLL